MEWLWKFGERLGQKRSRLVVFLFDLALLVGTAACVWALVRAHQAAGTRFWALLIGGVVTGGFISITWHYVALIRRFKLAGWRAALGPLAMVAVGFITLLALPTDDSASPLPLRVFAWAALVVVLPYTAIASWFGYRIRKTQPGRAEAQWRRAKRMLFGR